MPLFAPDPWSSEPACGALKTSTLPRVFIGFSGFALTAISSGALTAEDSASSIFFTGAGGARGGGAPGGTNGGGGGREGGAEGGAVTGADDGGFASDGD